MLLPFQRDVEAEQVRALEALGSGEGGLETLAQEAWGRGCSAIDLILERGLRSAQDLRAAQASSSAERILWAGFEIEGELGRGAAGVVYAARKAEAALALKVLHQGSGERATERFRREVAILRRLDHPGIVRLLHAGRHEGADYLATELEPRGSCEDNGLPIAPAAALRVSIAVAEALAAAHAAGIVHRDLKPSNVLLGRGGRPRLVDFGLAKDVDAASLTRSRMTLGSPAWVAPEQLGQAARVDARADVYGLGALLWGLLCGGPPYAAKTFTELVRAQLRGPGPLPASVPLSEPARARVDTFLLQALAPRRDLRQVSAEACAQELRHCAAAVQD